MARKKMEIDNFGTTVTVEIEEVNAGEHITVRGRRVLVGQEYDVYLLGTFIGKVRKSMVTRERRTRGRTYVNARWQTPAWQRSRPSLYPSWFEDSSRVHAIRSLIALLDRKL